jgi:DNA-binding transcriptional ArsR family regulator
MSEASSQFPSPNRLIHEPARLAILTVLASCAAADFLFLQRITGLSKGNLSVQLSNLEQSGLVTITKEIIDKKTRTTVRLSQQGATEVEQYWRTMDEIRARMARREKQPQPQEEPSRLLPLDPKTQSA